MKFFTILTMICLSFSALGNFQQDNLEKQRELIVQLSESELEYDKELCVFIVKQFNDSLPLNRITAVAVNQEPAEIAPLDPQEVCK